MDKIQTAKNFASQLLLSYEPVYEDSEESIVEQWADNKIIFADQICSRDMEIVEKIRNWIDSECIQGSEFPGVRLIPMGNVDDILDSILRELEGEKA